jgi:hypothetical protein
MITDTLGPNQTFRTVDGKPIYWRDKRNVIHACEGSDVHRDVRLIWTLCARDVPANAAYKCDGEEVTCMGCRLNAAVSAAGEQNDGK